MVQLTVSDKTVFVCILIQCTCMLLCSGYKLPTEEQSLPLFRRSQLSGMVKEASHAVKGLAEGAQSMGSRISKMRPKGSVKMPTNKGHFANDFVSSSPKSILRPKQLSPPRSKISNRVSFRDKHVVQPSSSSKHTVSPYGGSIHRVQEHQGSKSARMDKKESFKNPWGHSSTNSATSKVKKNDASKRGRSQPQGSAFFQSMQSRQRSQRQSRGGGGRATSAASTAHSSAPSHSSNHHPSGTGEENEKPVKGIAKVARDYPGLGFAVTGATMIVGTTAIVTHNMRAKEEEVMRKKKELGVPPVDLSKERKAAQEKLQKQSQTSNPSAPPVAAPATEKASKPPPPPSKGKR